MTNHQDKTILFAKLVQVSFSPSLNNPNQILNYHSYYHNLKVHFLKYLFITFFAIMLGKTTILYNFADQIPK